MYIHILESVGNCNVSFKYENVPNFFKLSSLIAFIFITAARDTNRSVHHDRDILHIDTRMSITLWLNCSSQELTVTQCFYCRYAVGWSRVEESLSPMDLHKNLEFEKFPVVGFCVSKKGHYDKKRIALYSMTCNRHYRMISLKMLEIIMTPCDCRSIKFVRTIIFN